MKYRIFRLLSILFIISFLAPALTGQNILNPTQKEPDTPQDTTAAPILSVPVSRISQVSNENMNLVNRAGADRLTEAEIEGYTSEIDTVFATIDTFLNDTLYRTFNGFASRDFDNTSGRTDIYLNQIAAEQGKLTKRYTGLVDDFNALDAANKRWMATLDQSASSDIPEALVGRINQTMHSIDSVSAFLQEDIKKLLLQQDLLLDRKNKLESLKVRIQSARLSLSEHMFSRDMPGFFKDLSSFKDSALFETHAHQIGRSVKMDSQVFRSEFTGAVRSMIILFLFLLIFLYWFKSNYKKVISTDKMKLTQLHLKLIQSPLLVAVFATSILIRFIYPELPYTYKAVNMVIMAIPMVILIIRIFGREVMVWMYWLIGLYFMAILFEFLYAPDILQRIFLLFLSTASLGLFAWFLRIKPSAHLYKRKSIYKLVHNTEIVFMVLLVVAIIANLIGAFSLAQFLTLVPIQIAFLVLIVKVITHFVDLVLYIALASNFVLSLHAVDDFFDLIHKKITRYVNLFFWIFFVVMSMKILRIKDVFLEWGHKLLTTGRQIGEVSISLQSVLVFIFVMWLSLFITKIIRYLLERDVFVRVNVAKGVPGTIIMLVKVALITGGFFLAAAAAGMQLTNLSIILGAFSVGIGFGLQNIFNNMVSGLILAFERPINVGDVVEVGTLMGTVDTIGLRASTVKTFDGAEVIVPNGNLISNNLINWTLKDIYRRMDIRIGVAYGTDPDQVLGIMTEVAEEHTRVKKKPVPRAYFIGFGDSSLDFRLLAWVNIDYRLGTESEINTTISRKLAEAGIEIPFPQQDLHIRSNDTLPEPEAKPTPEAKPKPETKPKLKPAPKSEEKSKPEPPKEG